MAPSARRDCHETRRAKRAGRSSTNNQHIRPALGITILQATKSRKKAVEGEGQLPRQLHTVNMSRCGKEGLSEECI